MSTTTRPTRITARLDDEHAAKVERLRQETGLSLSDLVKKGINRLYEDLERERRPAIEGFRKSGFIGSGTGPEDLSVSYKEVLAEGWAGKHGER